jgi:hypothetical protein
MWRSHVLTEPSPSVSIPWFKSKIWKATQKGQKKPQSFKIFLKLKAHCVINFSISGLYYKHVTIVNNDSSGVSKLECLSLASFSSLVSQTLWLSTKICKTQIKKFCNIGPWALYHKTYYGCTLRFP